MSLISDLHKINEKGRIVKNLNLLNSKSLKIHHFHRPQQMGFEMNISS